MNEDDPDETEGRRLYRACANSLARAQLAMASRRVQIRGSDVVDAKTELLLTVAGILAAQVPPSEPSTPLYISSTRCTYPSSLELREKLLGLIDVLREQDQRGSAE